MLDILKSWYYNFINTNILVLIINSPVGKDQRRTEMKERTETNVTNEEKVMNAVEGMNVVNEEEETQENEEIELMNSDFKEALSLSLPVHRKVFKTKDKKELMGYYVIGSVRKRDIVGSIIPSDFGGFDLLDIISSDEDNPPMLIRLKYSMPNTQTGEVVSGYTYEMVSFDPMVNEYIRCKVKPQRQSDKSVIEMLFSIAFRKQEEK